MPLKQMVRHRAKIIPFAVASRQPAKNDRSCRGAGRDWKYISQRHHATLTTAYEASVASVACHQNVSKPHHRA